ncbi:cytochrome c oxidase accessory protein CcoG [Thalassospira xiamenensis]|uniref:cytochrome c oxidase accessory protein CcoG n=1 Tax=Thalassospira xiamenensis TaxID=220697 RepID=UPI000DEDBD1F|nr:cytochrome c oxidase accessory protein CcoG [Thalassospira xiamenensis]RCK41768.1 nitrogen fixation protein FixG [Thalassospira xiamenensis]
MAMPHLQQPDPAHPIPQNDTLPEDDRDQPLYKTRDKVYPKRVSGRFRNLKWFALVALLAIYWIVPWLRWDRGPSAPDQAVLIDMDLGRAYFFFIEIWPQEVYYITGLLILAAIGLFLATSLFGRIWCGYGCPQTVWTDLFMLVERHIQGDRNARMRLDKSPWTFEKVWKIGATHLSWLVIAAATGGAFVLYFHDAPTVMVDIFTGDASLGVYVTIAFLTFSTYLLAGWAREQVCTYMCPWPRFQSAMLDDESMIVTYEGWRGEPRGPIKRKNLVRGEVPKVGHCIDCYACFNVCPTGIDIRNGLQMECIGCGLCIDACNEMMDKVGFPRDLVRFDSVQNSQLRAHGKATKIRIVRPRTVFYSIIVMLVAGVMAFGLFNRTTLEVNVLRDRNPIFVRLSDGDVRNGYTLKVLNKEQAAKTYILTIEGLDATDFQVIGLTPNQDGTFSLDVAPDRVGSFRVFVAADPEALDGEATPFEFSVTDPKDNIRETYDTVFAGPK